MGWWWLSWADEDGCNGVAIVQGENFEQAYMRAVVLGIRPPKGGQVVGDSVNGSLFDAADLNRLLSPQEAKKYV